MTNLICKIFGHRVIGLNTKRHFAWCDRCDKGLKVSYDMGYGETLVVGDYGSQRTFCWCDCGNELCSSDSFVKDTDLVYYQCTKCGEKSKWMFDAPVPFRVKDDVLGSESPFETPCYKGGIKHKTCGALGSDCCWCKKHDCIIGREAI